MRKLLAIILILPIFNAIAQQSSDTLIKGKLLQNETLQIEATDAINQMYNFKFVEAEVKFRQIIGQYPEHPLGYYLIGLSNWWKMMPYGEDDPRIKLYEPDFDTYMELAIAKAEVIHEKDEQDIEATFFLCAAHGLIARHYAENSQEMRSLNNTRKAFGHFKTLNENNELSPEFLFGSALFNYYAAWFREEYPALRPLLALFPNGDKALGIKQLRNVSYNSFWTRTEAQYFLMRIYHNEEDDEKSALPIAEYLSKTFPDNPYFQRTYCRILFSLGMLKECMEVSSDILYKVNIGMPGYEENCGRYASFFLGRINLMAGQLEKAKEFYKKAIVFAEKANATQQNYYLYSLADMARISNKEKDIVTARAYYETLLDLVNKESPLRKEAKDYLEKTEVKKEKKGILWW